MERKYEYLRYEYTPDEITAAAHDLATANRKRDGIEQRKKEVVASLKSEFEEQNSAITRLSNLIAMGFEYRDIEVRIELDTPTAGSKRVIRLDTGEEVSVKPMTDTDRQMVLDLQTKAEAAEELDRVSKEMGEDRPKGPIVTPPPFVPRLEAGVPVGPEMQSLDKDGNLLFEGLAVEFIAKAAAGPTLAPARTQGGTHQKGTRGKRGRNLDAEAFADGSAVEFDGVPDEFMPEESPE